MRKAKITILLLAGLFAFAAAMAVASAADFDAVIVNLDGSPLLDDKGKEVSLTVRAAAVESLMTAYQDEPNQPAEEKIRREDLARRVLAKKTDDLSAEDVSLIKKLINKRYPSPLVVGQAWRALEKK